MKKGDGHVFSSEHVKGQTDLLSLLVLVLVLVLFSSSLFIVTSLAMGSQQPVTLSLSGFLFDLDGTIVDSTTAIVKHWQAFVYHPLPDRPRSR